MEHDPVSPATADFVEALTELRVGRGLSKKDLAAQMDFDPSYVSHVESGRHRPTIEFADRADAVLQAGGRLLALFERYAAAHGDGSAPRARGVRRPLPAGLTVASERAELALDEDGYYHVRVVREIVNSGDAPLTRFPARIEVDAHPHDHRASALFYRDNPVTLAELGFEATFNGAPTCWSLARDYDAYKKIYINFRPHDVPTPVYPGDSAVVGCAYRLHESKWGPWFEREIRWPTDSLSISLRFPTRRRVRLTAAREVTWSADNPLPQGTTASPEARFSEFAWDIAVPRLTNQYRFDWIFAATAT